jgi:arylsulfatase A-like enzyme
VEAAGRRIDQVVVVLLDSLNRHHLGCDGGTEFATPNLDRFARRATRFTRHHTGSLPCMPARNDILCGALDFLWKPRGSIELWSGRSPQRSATRA